MFPYMVIWFGVVVESIVDINNRSTTIGEYAIFDAFGREILRGPIASNLTTIDVAALISGVYILKIKDKVLKFTKL